MKKIVCYFVFFLVISVTARAQFVAEAPLGPVEKDGFYEILLPPKVTALLSSDNSNLRILGKDNAEIPYITNIERPEYNNIAWKAFRFDKELKKGCCTIVTLYNDDKKPINNFLLEVKNAAIQKFGTLRGSDDGKTWYALKEDFGMSLGELNANHVMEVFDFPLSDYAYYQLTINDSTSSPLNVVGAWLTSENVVQGMFVKVPGIKFTQIDSASGRFTWLTIYSDTTQYIDRLEFDIEGPRFYKRSVTYDYSSFDIISGQMPVVYLNTKSKKIRLRVDNENNPPLKFKDIRAFQLRKSVVAYLEASGYYRLAIGADSLMRSPVYDLAFFRDSIPAKPTTIEIGDLKGISTAIKQEESSPTYFKDKRLIWAAILLVIAVLAGMTARMLKDKDFNKGDQ